MASLTVTEAENSSPENKWPHPFIQLYHLDDSPVQKGDKRKVATQLLNVDLQRKKIFVRNIHTQKTYLLDLPNERIPRYRQSSAVVQLGMHSSVSDMERDLWRCHVASTDPHAFVKLPSRLVWDVRLVKWTPLESPLVQDVQQPTALKIASDLPIPSPTSEISVGKDPFARLPNELLMKILSYNPPRDQAAMHRVNSRMMKVVPKPVVAVFLELRGNSHWWMAGKPIRRELMYLRVLVHGSGKKSDCGDEDIVLMKE